MFKNDVLCIGDLHGDYEALVKILKTTKIINDKLQWIGNDTYVVQLGDLLDGKRPGIISDKTFLKTPGEIELMNLK